MAGDKITEFEDIDPLEIHLVGTPANKFAPLLAKSRQEKGKQVAKTGKTLRKLQKALAVPTIPSTSRPHVTGVDIAGSGASTIGRTGRGVFEALDEAVETAKASLERASSPLERARAKADRDTALRRRFLVKRVAQENAARRGELSSELIPGAFPIFKDGSTYALGDDQGLYYR